MRSLSEGLRKGVHGQEKRTSYLRSPLLTGTSSVVSQGLKNGMLLSLMCPVNGIHKLVWDGPFERSNLKAMKHVREKERLDFIYLLTHHGSSSSK